MQTTMRLDPLVVFHAVAQERSFTRAGAHLGLDKARVSRVVSALERELQRPLLVRSTRSVSLTAEGQALFTRVSPLLAGLREAVSSVPDGAAVPSGEVALTTTPDLARAVVAPALVSFRARYPAVRVRLVVASEMVDLMRAGVDLALRVGHAGAGSLLARRVGSLEAAFYASPSYLERRGAPRTLGDLASHDGLWPTPKKGQRSFSPGGAGAAPPAVGCADFTVLAELARLGAGVALLPTFLGARLVAEGALVRVVSDVVLGQAPLFLVTRPLKPMPPRVKVLADWLAAHLR